MAFEFLECHSTFPVDAERRGLHPYLRPSTKMCRMCYSMQTKAMACLTDIVVNYSGIPMVILFVLYWTE